jgi:hypothetical protein
MMMPRSLHAALACSWLTACAGVPQPAVVHPAAPQPEASAPEQHDARAAVDASRCDEAVEVPAACATCTGSDTQPAARSVDGYRAMGRGIAACLERAVDVEPPHERIVPLLIDIDDDGHVKRAVLETPFGSPGLDECIENAARSHFLGRCHAPAPRSERYPVGWAFLNATDD